MNQLKKYHLFPTILLLSALTLLGLYLRFFTNHEIQWTGFIAMMIFYGMIFYLGTYAAQLRHSNDAAGLMLAGRKLPLGLAAITMSATWVGGGYINGTAEYAAGFGLVWVQAPWGYAMSLILGGLIFAGKMRRHGFHTMLDPLEQRFGKRMGAVLFLPALSGEIFWTAAILTALGTTFGTILGLDTPTAIIISALIVIAYTVLGGLWAVALTDVVQLFLLLGGLFLALPIALKNSGGWHQVWATYQESYGTSASFLPTKEALGNYYWQWWDFALLLMLGGIPWQVYFQRVLASKNAKTAIRLSILAGVICIIAAIPATVIGIISHTTDWAALQLPPPPDAASTLPHAIHYLTNPWVATIGLGAVAAAVMSSADSSILSAASMAGWNVYRPLINPKIDTTQLAKVIRRCISVIGLTAMVLALNIQSVYELWFLCSDFVYCLLFPQLVCALFDKKANLIGSAAGFAVAFCLRFGGGDATLGLPILIEYPMIEDGTVLFPFRTLAMVSSLLTIVIVSRFTQRWAAAIPLKVVNT